MKKINLSWVGLLAFSLLAASCCNDEGDDDIPPVIPTGVVKLPSKISAYYYSGGSSTPTTTRVAQFKYNTDNSISEMNDNGEILKFAYNGSSQLTKVDHYLNETSTTIAYSEKITYGTDTTVFREEVISSGLTRDFNIFTNTAQRTLEVADDIVTSPSYTEVLYFYDSKNNIVKTEYHSKANGIIQPVFTTEMTYDAELGVFSKVKLSTPWTICSSWANKWDIPFSQANNIVSNQIFGGPVFIDYVYDYDTDGYPVRAIANGKVMYEFEYNTIP